MSRIPTITATTTADGYELSRAGVRLGVLFRVPAGWVTAGRTGRNWRRSQPYPTAAKAADARWGAAARDALQARETVPEVA